MSQCPVPAAPAEPDWPVFTIDGARELTDAEMAEFKRLLAETFDQIH